MSESAVPAGLLVVTAEVHEHSAAVIAFGVTRHCSAVSRDLLETQVMDLLMSIAHQAGGEIQVLMTGEEAAEFILSTSGETRPVDGPPLHSAGRSVPRPVIIDPPAARTLPRGRPVLVSVAATLVLVAGGAYALSGQDEPPSSRVPAEATTVAGTPTPPAATTPVEPTPSVTAVPVERVADVRPRVRGRVTERRVIVRLALRGDVDRHVRATLRAFPRGEDRPRRVRSTILKPSRTSLIKLEDLAPGRWVLRVSGPDLRTVQIRVSVPRPPRSVKPTPGPVTVAPTAPSTPVPTPVTPSSGPTPTHTPNQPSTPQPTRGQNSPQPPTPNQPTQAPVDPGEGPVDPN